MGHDERLDHISLMSPKLCNTLSFSELRLLVVRDFIFAITASSGKQTLVQCFPNGVPRNPVVAICENAGSMRKVHYNKKKL